MLAILLMESVSKNNNTDYKYIKSIFDYYYGNNNRVKLEPIFMKGKSNYNRMEKEIDKRITNYRKVHENKDESIEIFMCVDTDEIFAGEDQLINQELNNEISHFCAENGYNEIWFCRDIEEVSWGTRFSKSSEKKRAAEDFIRKNQIELVPIERLSWNKSKYEKCYSNIITVFDKFFKRKC